MEFVTQPFIIEIVPYQDLIQTHKDLIIEAVQARDKWNQPVSWFHVWAATRVIWSHKEIYIGANCENVNYNWTTHAEQHAITAALLGRNDTNTYDNITVEAFAVLGAMNDKSFDAIINESIEIDSWFLENKWLDELMKSFVTPCGHCRQIYDPFLTSQSLWLLLNKQWYVAKVPLQNLLPFSFSKIA